MDTKKVIEDYKRRAAKQLIDRINIETLEKVLIFEIEITECNSIVVTARLKK